MPDFVITLTTAPELRPYSASKVLLMTRNSSIASGVGWIGGQVDELIVGVAAIDAEVVGAPAATVDGDGAGVVAAVECAAAGTQAAIARRAATAGTGRCRGHSAEAHSPSGC